MNALVSLVLALFVGCATAGLVEDVVTSAQVTDSGLHITGGSDPVDTTALASGAFAMELVPVKDSNGIERYTLVRLSYHKTDGTYHSLQLVKMNWPDNVPSIEVAKESIKPVWITDRMMRVKYYKVSTYLQIEYTWVNNAFVQGNPVEKQIQGAK